MSENEPNEPQSGAAALEAARRVKLRKIQELGLDPGASASTNIRPSPRFAPAKAKLPRNRPPSRASRRTCMAPRSARQGGSCSRAARASCIPRNPRLDRHDPGDDRQEPGRRGELGAGQVLRPGRPDRRRWRTEADQDGRADDLRRAAALPHQVDRHAAGEAQGPGRSRTAAADAVSRSDLHRRRAGAVPAADEDRAIDPQHAGRRAASSRSKGRRCTPSPAGRPPGRSSRTTTRSISICICGSPWSCT